MVLPLGGLRVLDLSRALAGPFCTMILGDLGADVVKVEPLPDGEMIRNWGPFHSGISTYYLSINRNKRSLALNFRDARALELLREMTRYADVIVENFKPGTMEEMELSYDALHESNQRLIYASITGFGRDGPYGSWPGVDQIAQGLSGLMSITGTSESGPLRVGVPIGDMLAGMWTALGIQSAIIQRLTSGKGQRVETSLLASLVGMLCVQGQRYLSLGDIPPRVGNDHPVICPYGTFEAKDGPFNMAATSDAMWGALCRLIDLEDLIEHADFRNNSARMKNKEEVRRRLNARFSARPRLEWTRKLVELGLPAGPIYDLAEVFADPQVKHLNLAESVNHPVLGPVRLLSNPIRLDALEGRSVREPPPLLGQHSEQALRDYGISGDRVRELKGQGIIKQADGRP